VNPSHDRDRDHAIERLLRQPKAPAAATTNACLDAETLAAWADGSLSADELERAQMHAAGCRRCQATVGALMQITRAANADAGSRERQEAAPRRWLAWLVPLTAAAAALAIWVAVPRGPGAGVRPATIAETQPPPAQAKADAPTASAQPVEPFARLKELEPPAVRSDQPARGGQAQAAEAGKDADRREVDLLKQRDTSAGSANEQVAAASAAAPPAAPAPAAPPVARETMQARSATSASARISSFAMPPSWRISGTALQHSPDGGSTWNAVATGVTSPLTAVSSPSSAVCWVVGRGGVVLRTTDGQMFARVAFPEITDLSAVQAADAESATVTTADGRVFATANGGASWQRP